jgi:hypothetical protein
MPIKVADGSRATLYAFRPVLLAQLPYRVAPFVRAGIGMLGISSSALGKDIDPSFNIGGGVKFYINQRAALRLDIVDNIATAVRRRQRALEQPRGPARRLAAPRQAPGSGALTRADRQRPRRSLRPGPAGRRAGRRGRVPAAAGPAREPGLPVDRQRRRRLLRPGPGGRAGGERRRLSAAAGPARDPGLPAHRQRRRHALRPRSAGAGRGDRPVPEGARAARAAGLPRPRQGHKIPDRLDKCPDVPETVNQIDDADGCPDERPKAVEKISGVIEGIYFDVDKDTIKPRSRVPSTARSRCSPSSRPRAGRSAATPTPTARASTTSTCRTAAPHRCAST